MLAEVVGKVTFFSFLLLTDNIMENK